MRRIAIALVLTGALAGGGHLAHALFLSGVPVLDAPLAQSSHSPPPFELATQRTLETYRLAPVALDPGHAPYRASLVLWGSGMRTDYGVALLGPRGDVAWLAKGNRKKGKTPSRSTSVLGSFEVEERGLHRFVVAISERPGIVPSGGSLQVRGQVAPVRRDVLLASGLAVLLGLVLIGRGGDGRAGER